MHLETTLYWQRSITFICLWLGRDLLTTKRICTSFCMSTVKGAVPGEAAVLSRHAHIY